MILDHESTVGLELVARPADEIGYVCLDVVGDSAARSILVALGAGCRIEERSEAIGFGELTVEHFVTFVKARTLRTRQPIERISQGGDGRADGQTA
jgi:hypothetical protein